MKGWLEMSKCKKTSVVECIRCEDSQCKNLWGPIKEHSRCYEMIKNKLFDECVFGCQSETDLNGCSWCEHRNNCSVLIRQCVAMLDM